MPRAKRKLPPPDTIWAIPDNLWPAVEALLAEYYPPAPTGRPRAGLRRVLDGIIYRMRTGCQWNRLPREFGSDTTVHRWFQRFVADGVFEDLWAVLVSACAELGGVSWQWQAADTVLNKARFGGTSSARTRRTGGSRGPSGASSPRRAAARWGRSWPRRTSTTAR
jgi:transposase